MKPLTLVVTFLLPYLIHLRLYAQDTPTVPGADKITARYLNTVADKSGSTGAAKAFTDSKKQYAALLQKLAGAWQKINTQGRKYIPLLYLFFKPGQELF